MTTMCACVPSVACVVAVVAPAAFASAQTLEATVPLPAQASARDLLYNPLNNKVYTANTPQVGQPPVQSVTILNGATNAVIASPTVADGPRDFCLNTQRNKVYVANYFADCVTVIDGVTDQIVAVVPVGDGPRALCYNAQDDRVYCANEFGASVTVLDGGADTVVATVAVGSTPRVLCYNATSNKVYVPNAGSQSLSVIAGATNTVVATVPVGNVPRGILFNPQNNRVYCSNYGSDTVTVVDGVTNAVVATVPVGDGPTALFHNPVGNKVYCANVGAPGPNTPAACTVSVIGGATNAVVATLPAGDEPTAFCFSSNNQKVYWINEWSHSVAVVDAATDTTLQVIPLGAPPVQPVDICYNPINERIYTANKLTYTIGILTDSRDVSLPTVGSAVGAPFDLRAPAAQRIAVVELNVTTGLDGVRLRCAARSGEATAATAWAGTPGASPSTFAVPVGDHLARVEVWHDVANSRLSGLALQARGGQRQVFGQQVGVFQAFDAPVGSEIVGLRGTANAAVPSLGVVHRPLLGGYVAAGVACGSNVGVLTARFRAGEDRVRVGDAAVVEVTNVASPFGIVAIGFTALAVPLDAAGAPGCWVYSSAEALLLAPKDAANIAATPFQVPPSVVLVGVRLELQGGSLLAPNMLGLATSGALRVQVGAL
jgi:YVTN family beta-propeller protein